MTLVLTRGPGVWLLIAILGEALTTATRAVLSACFLNHVATPTVKPLHQLAGPSKPFVGTCILAQDFDTGCHEEGEGMTKNVPRFLTT